MRRSSVPVPLAAFRWAPTCAARCPSWTRTAARANVYQLSTSGALHPATGMGHRWHTNPQLRFVAGTWEAWTPVGRDLVRMRLEPR